MNTISLWVGIILIVTFFATYIWGENRTRKNLIAIQKKLAGNKLDTVSAGSHYKTIPPQMKSVSTEYNLFKLSSGESLNTEDYSAYVVQGDSMQFCDIHTGDIVFARKNFRIEHLSKFPSVVILKNLKASPTECQFKMRRAWKICQDNLQESECVDMIRQIMASSAYLNLKEKARDIYESDEVMLSGFIKKLSKYRGETKPCGQEIVISTTYDDDNKKIRFSIHPASTLIGVVEFVTSVTNSCQ